MSALERNGHLLGGRKAADEYLEGQRILLSRTDYSGCTAIKQEDVNVTGPSR